MNPPTQPLKASLQLKSVALVAILCGVGSAAQAGLVGHWLAGQPDLNETSGYRPAGTHDGVAVGPNAGSLTFSNDVPAGFSGKSLDLIGNVGVSVANSATGDAGYLNTYDDGIRNQFTIAFWAKGFPGTWAPWVSKRGENGVGWQLRRMGGDPIAGFTLRGVDNEDGWGSSINVQNGQPAWHHYAGVWDQATGTRKLYVDGVFSHTVSNAIGQALNQAADKRLTLGARADGGTGYEAYFSGKLYDVRIYDTPLTQNEIVALILIPPTGLQAAPANGKVGLQWTAVPAATSYTVWTKNTVTSAEQTDTTADAFFTKTGLDNGTPYLFKVKATNSLGSSDYSAEVGATPAMSAAKEIVTFTFGTYGNATIAGTNITKYLPATVNLTTLAPTYTTSLFATGSPVSGTARDFTYPQTYTITAEDGTTKEFTVTVALVNPITYDFTGGLQGWTQIWPVLPAVLWQDNALGSGYDGIAPDDTFTRFGRSPVFYLLDAGPLTFQLRGGQSPLAVPHLGPSAIPEQAIENGGFAGVALRDVETNTYVLSRRRDGNDGGVFQQLQFTAAELAPYVNNGKEYTLDYLDYNRGGWGWTYMDNVSIPGVAVKPGTEALITTFTLGETSDTSIAGTDITVWLPKGTPVTALNPLFSVSPGATVSPPLGTVRDFTTPQDYTVTSGDNLATSVYTVTVVADGALNVRTYDTTFGTTYLNPIANLYGVTPSATAVRTAAINYDGNFVGPLPGLTNGDSFSVIWDGWFDVSVEGPGDYTFGTESDDGSVLYLDLNNDGDFADPGEMIIDNNRDQGPNVTTGTVNLPMDSVRFAIGFYENGGGDLMRARFGKGRNLAFGSLTNISGHLAQFQTTQPPVDPASSALWYFTSAGRVAQPYGSPTQLLLNLPVGSTVTSLAPTFVLSPGATCVPPSGTARDFTTPQTYTVTSQDSSTTTVFTVIARVASPISVKTYDTTAGTGFLAPLSNLQAVTPTYTATQLADINYESDASFTTNLPGLTSADTFAVLWEGWFNVGADGPGDYTFGTRSDDGSVLYLDLSNDGDFDDAGELIVNSNYLQGSTVRTATVKLLMDKVRFAIGFFEQDGGQAMEARFGKGTNVAWDNLTRVSGNTGLFTIPEPASKPSSAALWYVNFAGNAAVTTNPEGTSLLLAVPLGYDLTALDPAFNISPGATCVPPSGTVRDFTTPQTYTVTSQDSSATADFTVSVYQYQGYDFNGGTLQGWHNRVWDLAANGGAGGWIELAPNATTMPNTVNGGASQPPSVDNGLYGVQNASAWPNGNTDNHLNTQWLRSPAFYLDAVADLTVQLGRGTALDLAPADEAGVPSAAVTDGGWKGVILRRVSDGAFLLAKPRTGANDDQFRTVTFTVAELEPFDGVACTLELINSSRGGWGWVVMDNVVIPTTGLVPLTPYEEWLAAYPDLVGAMGQPGADPDADGLSNLEELAFATDPMVANYSGIAYAEGNVTSHGLPILETAGGYAAVFGRRVDRAAMGVTYTVQFSADLSTWVDSAAEPVVLATDAEIEAVSVAFPATIDTPGGAVVPRFFRIKLGQN
jgi:hypothetical protein